MSEGRAGHGAAGAADRPAPILESGPADPAQPLVGRGALDAAEPGASFDFAGPLEWRVIVSADGVPCAYPHIASPGERPAPWAAEVLLQRHAASHRRREEETARLRARLGAGPEHGSGHPSVTVAICTRRRRADVRAALEAVAGLDPAPFEVVVVDNDPGDEDCRDIAEEYGARYAREERAGLDLARRRGLVEARGEIVAYLDDDCRPPTTWLARLGRFYEDPTVGAVTGPAFAQTLDTPARVERERLMSFVHGLALRRYDWGVLRPVVAGATGAGANMTFRRDLMLALGEVFPTDLDLGTPTRGGGDLYALYSVLAGGRCTVYDPGTWMLHSHPADLDSLRRTGETWGLGFSAFLTKVLVERRELPGLQEWWWLVREYARAIFWTLPAPDPAVVRVRFDYLRGGVAGPFAWVLARRGAPPRASLTALPAPASRPPPGAEGEACPGVAIVRADTPAECNALAAQATGDILVFLARDAGAAPGLAAAHAAAHGAAHGARDAPPAIVVGSVRARTPAAGLTAQRAAFRADHRDHLRVGALAPTLADVPSGNVSMPRALLERLGGFDTKLSGARAMQDLAARALAAGATLARAPDAVAWADPPRRVADVLAAARAAGEECAALARRHPQAAGALAPPATPSLRTPRGQTAAALLLRAPRARRMVPAVSAVLEAGRLRASWLALVDAAERGAYADGWRAGGGAPLQRPVHTVDLLADDLIEAPTVAAPLLDVRIGARRVTVLRPRFGCWHRDLAEQIVESLSIEDWRELNLARNLPSSPNGAPPPMAVVVGPGSRGEALRVAGVEVVGLEGGWRGVDAAIRGARADVVACALPGVRVDASWPVAVRRAFVGDRVAVAVGTGLAPGELPSAIQTTARRLRRGRYESIGPGAQYVAVAREAYERLGGFDPELVALAPHAAVLDLVERARDAGAVVAYADVPGMQPVGTLRPARSALKWRATRARGSLIVLKAGERGPVRGALWVLANLLLPQAATLAGGLHRRREPSLRHWAGTSAALAVGALEQLLRSRRG